MIWILDATVAHSLSLPRQCVHPKASHLK